jgi:PHS family inorganic phosphate transporter-like MFS transporter
MIAAVFFMQAFGQLIGTSVALAATEGFRRNLLGTNDPSTCSINVNPLAYPDGAECARALDSTWRLVSGLGAFPAVLAIVSRLTIPESVRKAHSELHVDSLLSTQRRSTGSLT